MRDLVRARHSAMEGVRRARQQLLSFLLRHGRIYPTKRHWTRAHRRWLAEQRFEHPAQQIVFEELIQAVEQVMARRDRLEQQMIALVPNWSLQPVVAALQALRGVAMVAAIILAAEIGDFRRFANPRQLMAWLGLVPREHSSGASTSRGAITKAGNGRARRLLIESAWTYRLPARIASQPLGAQCGPARSSEGGRLEGASPALCPLPTPAVQRQADQCRHRRNRPRTRRLCLGHRNHRHAGAADHLKRQPHIAN